MKIPSSYSIERTVSKKMDLVERYSAYNFYLECFSVRRQRGGQVRSTAWQNLKNHNS